MFLNSSASSGDICRRKRTWKRTQVEMTLANFYQGAEEIPNPMLHCVGCRMSHLLGTEDMETSIPTLKS